MRLTLLVLLQFVFLYSSFSQSKKVSFLFVGDAMQHQSQIDAAKTEGGYDYSNYFKNIEDKVNEADVAVVNLEVALGGKPYNGYPMFSAPDEYAVALKDAGFDIFLLANNHCLDRRKKGLERTIQVLDSLKIKHTGTFVDETKRELYYPLMMIKNGIRIAMLNYTYGTNGVKVQSPNIVNYIDRQQIKADIDMAKRMKADIIIANMHWGDEYLLKENKTQRDLADFLLQNGVRLIIGNHPHVVQPIDVKTEGGDVQSVTVYSLGNFISGMKKIDCVGGSMLRIDISKEEDQSVKIEDIECSLLWTKKTIKNGVYQSFELISVDDFYNEEGKEHLGTVQYEQMKLFAKNAKKAINSLCAEGEELIK